MALPRGDRDTPGPPGTKVPSWFPGWQEVGTAERGWKKVPHMPAREGVPIVPRLSYPLGLCLRFGTAPWREEGKYTHAPWATHDLPPSHPGPLEQSLGSCLPGLFPPLCAGL